MKGQNLFYILFFIGFFVGNLAYSQTETEKLDLYKTALTSKNKELIFGAAKDLGDWYRLANNPAKALEFYQNALKNIDKKTAPDTIGQVFHYMGLAAKDNKNFQKSLQYQETARQKLSETKDSVTLTYVQYEIGKLYKELKNPAKAFRELQEAVKIASEGNFYDIAVEGSGQLVDIANTNVEYYGKLLGDPKVRKNNKQFQEYRNLYIDYKNYARLYGLLKSALSKSKEELERKDQEVAEIDKKNKLNEFETNLHKTKMKQQEYEMDKKKEQLRKQEEELEKQRLQSLLYGSTAIGTAALLALALFAFIRIRRERARSEALLLNILPKEIAEELKRNRKKKVMKVKPKHYEQVTILFTDFKGFTQIAEKLTPEQIIEELDKCFLAFDEIIQRNNMEKIKTIGDAYMCAGGVPVANQTNPFDAVNAALEMQVFMEKWKKEKVKKGEPFFEVRIGIHTGKVVAGVVGKFKFAYDTWGDAVNLASRMESSGEPNKVNISSDTYEIVQDKYVCVHRGKISAKNKGDVDMYFVEGRK